MIALPLLAAALIQAEPPRGVNGTVLGTAEQFSVSGPARVCFFHTSLDLAPGETAYLDYLGIHWASIRVSGARGSFLVREGDNWAAPDEPGRPARDRHGRNVVKHHSPEGWRYLIFGRTTYSPDRERPLVWLEGDAIDGSNRDRQIINRVRTSSNEVRGCARRFVYGLVLDEE